MSDFPAMTIRAELLQVLAELDLVSHVPALDYESKRENKGSVSDDRSPGGKRPRGGADRKDDREREYSLKSADHFRRRLARAHSQRTLEVILEEAKAALAAWRRQPAPTGEPEYGSPQWKRWVAESKLPSSEIARKYGVSGQYIRRIRALYRDAA